MQKSKARRDMHAGAALLAALLLGACGALRPDAARAEPPGEAAHAEVPGEAAHAASSRIVMYLARRHWHIDVGFPARDLSPSLAFLAGRFPRAGYFFFGFGDRHYLLAKRQGSSTLSGALLPGPGIVLVTALENSPAQAFGASHVLEFDLSAAEMAAAQSFVRRTLSGDQGATELPSVAEGPYEGSLYYGAEPRYSALHTCNTWAAEALDSAGLPVRTRLVVLAGQLWRQARRIAAPGNRAVRGGVLAPGYPQQTPQSQGGGLPF
jgi:hypothetical protein